MTITRTVVVSHFSCLWLQFCSYFQWENNKECQTIFTTLSHKDEATHSVRIFLPSNISLVSLFCHDTEDTLMLLHMTFFRPVIRGRPSKRRSIHICGRPRWIFVLLFSAGWLNTFFLQSPDIPFCTLWIYSVMMAQKTLTAVIFQLVVCSGWPPAASSQFYGHYLLVYLVRPRGIFS